MGYGYEERGLKEPIKTTTAIGWIAIGAGAFLSTVIVIVVIWAGLKSFSRYQRVADAKNEQRVIEMRVDQTRQLVEVEKQKASVRVAEAEGIAESQRIIDSSLTEDYLTYLAIQAQMEMSHSPNTTVIYIPVGDNGIPLVRDTATDETP